MKHLLATLLLALLTSTLLGCGGNPYETILMDQEQEMDQMVLLLKGIDDADSAKAAEPKLNASAERLQAIFDRGKALGEPKEADAKILNERVGSLMLKIMELKGELARVGRIDGARDTIQKVQAALEPK